MLYDLVRTFRGKEEVFMTDSLAKCKSRKTALLKSQRKGIKGSRVAYEIVLSKETSKFDRGRSTMDLSGSSYRTPRLTKWNK